MWDLSLHILDVIEKSVRAGATRVSVTLSSDRNNDLVCLVVQDDGSERRAIPEEVLRPRRRKSCGDARDGLSLLRATASKAGGGLTAAPSDLGGVALVAMLRRDLVDRGSFGNIPATFESVASTHPGLDLECRLSGDGREIVCRSEENPGADATDTRRVTAAARDLSARIRDALRELGITAAGERKVG